MRSRCRELARDFSIALCSVRRNRASVTSYMTSLTVSLTIAVTVSVVMADSSRGESGANELNERQEQSPSQTTYGKTLLAQAANDSSMSTADGATSGSKPSGMSERIRKYMGGEDGHPPGDGPPGHPPGGPGRGPGEGEMGGREHMRERIRERLQQLPPEKREQVMQEMKERRMRKGMPDGPNGDGMGNRFMGADGGPEGAPGPHFRGRRGGNGISEFGYKRNAGRKDFGPGGDGKGMKGGKFFGREPLDLTVLNLTADQKAKIQTLRTADGQKARQLQIELRQRRDKFRDMLFDPAATTDQILGTHREINKLQSQTQDIMLNDFLGIRKLLTKEQLELLPQVRPEESRRPSPKLGQKPPPPPPDDEGRPPGPPGPPLRGDFDPTER